MTNTIEKTEINTENPLLKEADSLHAKAMNSYKMGKLPESYDRFQKASKLYKELGKNVEYFAQLRYMGVVKENMNYEKDAELLYRKSLDGLKQYENLDELTESYYRLGTVLYREDDKEGAIATFKEAAERGCKNSNLFNNLGFILIEKGELTDAESYFLKALDCNKDDDAIENLALNNLGVTYYLQKEYKKAAEKLEEASVKAVTLPKNERTIQYIILCNKENKNSDAKQYDIFDEVMTLAGIELNLAATYVMLGELEKAKETCRKATERDGMMAYVQLPAAWIYLATGEESKAITTFKSAMRSNPEQAQELEQIVKSINPFAFIKANRNDPCPCGSGKKYKKCHGKNA